MRTDQKAIVAMVVLTILAFGGFVYFTGMFFTEKMKTDVWLIGAGVFLTLSCGLGAMATWFALQHIADLVVGARKAEVP